MERIDLTSRGWVPVWFDGITDSGWRDPLTWEPGIGWQGEPMTFEQAVAAQMARMGER